MKKITYIIAIVALLATTSSCTVEEIIAYTSQNTPSTTSDSTREGAIDPPIPMPKP